MTNMTPKTSTPWIFLTSTGVLTGAVISINQQTQEESKSEQVIKETDQDSDNKTDLMHSVQDDMVEKRLQAFDNWWKNKDNQQWAKERGFFEFCEQYEKQAKTNPDNRFQNESLSYNQGLKVYYDYLLIDTPKENYKYNPSKGFMQQFTPVASTSAMPEMREREKNYSQLDQKSKENARELIMSKLKQEIPTEEDIKYPGKGVDPGMLEKKKEILFPLLEIFNNNPDFLTKNASIFGELYRINSPKNEEERIRNLFYAEKLFSILKFEADYREPAPTDKIKLISQAPSKK